MKFITIIYLSFLLILTGCKTKETKETISLSDDSRTSDSSTGVSPKINLQKDTYSIDESISVNISNISKVEGDKSWVAIYAVGDSEDINNAIYYKYINKFSNKDIELTQTSKSSSDIFSAYKNINDETEYELRLEALVDDRYVTYDTKYINIKPIQYAEQIEASFYEHYTYFKDQLHLKLKKDSDGYNDTYVLYYLQMHMQNAIIYADENMDINMTNKLLELVMIPFEERYMTNGLWLTNTHNFVGLEVTLVDSQYFSLLTRVLSVAERQGILNSLDERKIDIIINHIDKWVANSKIDNIKRLVDRDIFIAQSIMQFYNLAKRKDIEIEHLDDWKNYVSKFKLLTDSFVENVPCNYNNKAYQCISLERTWGDHDTYAYAGYGLETTSDMMFDENGDPALDPKPLEKVSADVSHARRYNWYLETIKRYGEPFKVSISDELMERWANNLAYKVSIGTVENPHFTIYSDGVDGWFRVGYAGRKYFGYRPGMMDIHFVGSSYGMMGRYNPKIYTWMDAWAKKSPNKMKGYYGGYMLDYLTSKAINIKNEIPKL